MCKANHVLYLCQRFLDSNLNTKLEFIKTSCANTVNVPSILNICKFELCRKCKKKQNTLIHSDTSSDIQAIALHSVCDETHEPVRSPAVTLWPAHAPADTLSVHISSSQVNYTPFAQCYYLLVRSRWPINNTTVISYARSSFVAANTALFRNLQAIC